MEFPLIHISNIISPLYPIVIHFFILVGYPTYRDKNLYLWSPYSTSWYIIILSRVKHPYKEILAISAWHYSTEKRETHHELLTVLWVTPTCRQVLPYLPSKTLYGPTNLGANFPLTPNCLTPRSGDTRRYARSPIS